MRHLFYSTIVISIRPVRVNCFGQLNFSAKVSSIKPEFENMMFTFRYKLTAHRKCPENIASD